jgi:hypothetical protein
MLIRYVAIVIAEAAGELEVVVVALVADRMGSLVPLGIIQFLFV